MREAGWHRCSEGGLGERCASGCRENKGKPVRPQKNCFVLFCQEMMKKDACCKHAAMDSESKLFLLYT